MSDAQDMSTPEAREAYYRAAWEVAAIAGAKARDEVARLRRENNELRGALLLLLRWEDQAPAHGGLASDMAFARRVLAVAGDTGGCGVTTVPASGVLKQGRPAPRPVKMERQECSACRGSGFRPDFDGDGPMECRTCHGRGSVVA